MTELDNRPAITERLSLKEAARFWFWLGCISFGGPAGQIALMHDELVEKRRWISEQRFLHALNYCMVLPGPEAQQLATYIGWLLHGVRGGILAGLFFILPSFFFLLGLSWLYLSYGRIPWIAAGLSGIQPIVVALVFAALYRTASRALHGWWLIGIAIATWIGSTFWHLPFPLLVVFAAGLGWLGGRCHWIPPKKPMHHGPASTSKGHVKALLDDDDLSPPHARLHWQRMSAIAILGFLLWTGPLVGLSLLDMGGKPYQHLAQFFSLAALVTFGGAYAVLPYVASTAVDHYHWLDAKQMMDGLAFGESTPGPLIMIVTYVGFLAGYQSLGGDLTSGCIGASIATYFTFLPSFLFILLGGPWVERMRNIAGWEPILQGIMAAVVAVIANLGLYFAQQVFWNTSLPMLSVRDRLVHTDWLALSLTCVALWLLIQRKLAMGWLMLAGLLIGLTRFGLMR